MLEKMGWKKGEGLGKEGTGMKNPVRQSDSLVVLFLCYLKQLKKFFFPNPLFTDSTQNQKGSVWFGGRCCHVSRRSVADQIEIPGELGESA